MVNWMVKVKEEKDYVQIPNETARAVEVDCENPISLEAEGMLVNWWSYNVEKWELHKTQLYKRYAKNKRSSVDSAWNDLMNARYILQFNGRNEKGHFESIYLYRIRPFSYEEIETWKEKVKQEFGEKFIFVNEQKTKNVENKGIEADAENQHWDEIRPNVENPQWKNGSGKTAVGNVHISNTKEKKDIINKDLTTKTKLTKELKEKEKTLVSSSSDQIIQIDSIFKSSYPDAPLEQIKIKLFQDAENGLVEMKTDAQYMALTAKRVEFYLQAKEERENGLNSSQIDPESELKPIGELFPTKELSRQFEAFLNQSEQVEENEAISEPTSETVETNFNLEAHRKRIAENLTMIHNPEKTPEEIAEAKKEVERLMDELRSQKIKK